MSLMQKILKQSQCHPRKKNIFNSSFLPAAFISNTPPFLPTLSVMSNTATGPTNFADDGKDVIQRQLDVKSEKHDHIQDLYEIDRTVQRIQEGGYTKIALQFPDEYLADAASVARILVEKTGQEIFVLADTSYGSCCVDEVAAEHVSADLIIHYGRSCLSP